MFQSNIVSLTKHIDEIRTILYNCSDIHVLALNETRLDNSIYDSEIEIPQYYIVRKDHNRSGGGVSLYVNDSLEFRYFE